MANTKDLVGKLSDVSILNIGDGGSGKTHLIRGMPKPYVFDFDKGMATLRGVDIDYDTFRETPFGTKALKSSGMYEYGTAWPAFLKKVNEIGDSIDKGTCTYETLCIDSLTLMAQYCMNWILKNAGKAGQNPEIQHWGSFRNNFQTVLAQLTAWPLIKYVTAHIQRNENPVTEATEMLPLVAGKSSGEIPIYFDEVWFAEVVTVGVGANKQRKYQVVTKSDTARKSARSRWGVPETMEADWTKIEAEIKKGMGLTV